MKSALILDEEKETVTFHINGRDIIFTYEEFEELQNLYGDMNATRYLFNSFCIYRDDDGKLHRLGKE